MIQSIVSGGQTGVDRAALDTALKLEIPCGGWCPKDRRAEDGVLDVMYPLLETPLQRYSQRTEWNVRDSDGTLVLYQEFLGGGSAYTVELAKKYERPLLVLDLSTNPAQETVREWIHQCHVYIVNIAGPRESTRPGIYQAAYMWLFRTLSWEKLPGKKI